jgi:hypothetical protein
MAVCNAPPSGAMEKSMVADRSPPAPELSVPPFTPSKTLMACTTPLAS